MFRIQKGVLALACIGLFSALALGYDNAAIASWDELPLGGPSSPAARLQSQINGIFRNPLVHDSTPGIWNGQGDLPGAFQIPWKTQDTLYDPLFQTPYWSQKSGPINVSSAPWNTVLSGAGGTEFGSAVYDYGMRYVGKPFQSYGIQWIPQTDIQAQLDNRASAAL